MRKRAGFTLLELILATSIAVLLMAALYIALDTQLRFVDTGRDAVEEAVLARALLTRIGNDVAASLPPMVPPPSGSSGGGGSGAGGSGGATGGGASGAGGGTGGSTGANTGSTNSTGSSSSSSGSGSSGASSSSNSSSSASAMTSNLNGPVYFNLGLQGDNNRVVIYTKRVPREFDPTVMDPNNVPLVSDLRRVTYWLAGGSGAPGGLARQEIKLVTSDDQMGSVPPDVPDETSMVIAEEVKSLEIHYWDGQTWQDSWDGTVTSGSANLPMGPPLAVEIKIGVVPIQSRSRQANPATLDISPNNLKYYRHVVAIPAANGFNNTTTTTNSKQP
jgi:prepilin-type N-terminal cleavage/methylation domain-containing protein